MKAATGGALAILAYLLIPFIVATFIEWILEILQLPVSHKKP
jgi:hypothetical protein